MVCLFMHIINNLLSIIKKDVYFGGGTRIVLELGETNINKKIYLDIKNLLINNNVNIVRSIYMEDFFIFEFDDTSWRPLVEEIINNNGIECSVISKYNNNGSKMQVATFKITNKNLLINNELKRNMNLLSKLQFNYNIEKNGNTLELHVPHYIDVSEIKALLKCRGRFEIRRFFNSEMNNNNLQEQILPHIQTSEKFPNGKLVMNNLGTKNLISQVMAKNSAIMAKFHPKAIEKINQLSFKYKNSQLMFTFDDKVLFHQPLLYDSINLESYIGSIDDEKLKRNVILFLNLPHPISNFKIIKTEKIQPQHLILFKIILLLLLLCALIGFAIYLIKGKLRRILNFIIFIGVLVFNYLMFTFGYKMFMYSYCDIIINILMISGIRIGKKTTGLISLYLFLIITTLYLSSGYFLPLYQLGSILEHFLYLLFVSLILRFVLNI